MKKKIIPLLYKYISRETKYEKKKKTNNMTEHSYVQEDLTTESSPALTSRCNMFGEFIWISKRETYPKERQLNKVQ